MPINKNLITCEHTKAYIHLWPKLDQKQVDIGGYYEITDVEIEAFQEYLKELFNYVQSVGREALKQHIVRNFRHDGFTVNGVPLAVFDDVSEVLKSDLFKGQGPRAMEVMFQLIHSNNHETSSFVKDMLPVVSTKRELLHHSQCHLPSQTMLNRTENPTEELETILWSVLPTAVQKR